MLIIGHRGARGLAPENTLAAAKKGLEFRADMLEVDVRVTRDLVPVLHHNRNLKTAEGRKFDMRKHTYSELQKYVSNLTRLTDLFAVLPQNASLYIEVKRGEAVAPIAQVIKDAKRRKEQIFLASKSQKTLRALKRALPGLPLIVIEPWSGVRATHRARRLNTRRISMNRLWLWSGFIKTMSSGGYELYAYTLNDPKKAHRWQKYGLAGVVTDYPDLFVSRHF